MDKTQLRDLNRLATGGLTPDMTFLLGLDVRPGCCVHRADKAPMDRAPTASSAKRWSFTNVYGRATWPCPGRNRPVQGADATRSSAELQQVIWKVVQHVIQS